MATNTLLPDPEELELELIEAGADSITLIVRTSSREATCPNCRWRSTRVHSHYTRTIRDLPWSGVAVSLKLYTRRFFCTNANCEQKIFTERLSTLVAPYGRRTKRLQSALYLIGYVLGGEAGARLAANLGMKVSPDTLLRRVRQAVHSSSQPARVLGVDDWAWCKGQRYGTILVDLERRCLADLLPDDSSHSLGDWLKGCPKVEVISRDRSKVYREGARDGAPQAIQVADRWHLLKNLGDALERLLSRHHRHLREAAKRETSTPAARITKRGAAPVKPKVNKEESKFPPPRAVRECALRRERRLLRYQQVMELYCSGASISHIAREIGLSYKTVHKWVRADGFPERATRRSGPRKIDPFLPYLRERWKAGCHNAARLWREISDQGYSGGYSMVKEALATWRVRSSASKAKTTGSKPHHRPKLMNPSPRSARWLLLREPDEKKPAKARFHRRFVQTLEELCPQIKIARKLAQQFKTLVKEQRAKDLDPWIAEVCKCQIPELEGFANGLLADKEAVIAALSLEWSNGQVEGQIQRLKLIKRSMYGRANFDLLRARVLPAVV